MQMTCDALVDAANDAFWSNDWVGVEDMMTELEQRFPEKAAEMRAGYEDLIFERIYLGERGDGTW